MCTAIPNFLSIYNFQLIKKIKDYLKNMKLKKNMDYSVIY